MVLSRSLLSVAFAFSNTADAFWRMNCGIVQTGRIDPIISPGEISSHVHKIAGGSNININSTFESMRESACTSCEIQADKSGYWHPQLYYEHYSDGTFEEVPNSGMTVYYLGRGVNRENIVPFPAGFKMISGNPFARSYDNVTTAWGNATYPGELLANRVTFNCLDEEGPLPQLNYLWRTNCSDGLRAQLQFPSCWDGENLYLSDNSHVAYMSQIDNGVCPPTHPVQFVHLFFEVLYGVNSIDQTGGGRFVFANGDPTGYGFHGDFLNGWDPDTLKAGLAQCANPDNDGQISACAPFNTGNISTSDTSTYYETCPQNAPFGISTINETVRGSGLKSLPGCITITDGPDAADPSSIECPSSHAEPSLNVQPSTQTPIVYTIPKTGDAVGLAGWEFVNFYSDSTAAGSTRVLDGSSLLSSNMTIEVCQTYCFNQGERFAGIEFGDQCWCSSEIPSWANTTSTISFLPCPGNNTETCGNGGTLQVYNYTRSTATFYAPGAGPTPAAAGKYYGCATEGSGGRVLSGTSTTSSNMTLEMCRAFCDSKGFYFSGTEYSDQCYCGNSFANGGAMLSDNSTCSMICAGSKAETCGGSDRVSVFNSTSISMPTLPSIVSLVAEQGGYNNGSWKYAACIVDSQSPRALTGPNYFDDTAMTLESCAAFAQKRGQKYFGIEYAQQCYTGNSVNGSVASDTDCSMTCAGNKTQYCGAGWRLSTYVNLAAGEKVPALSSSTTATSTTTSSMSSSSKTMSTSSTSSSSKTMSTSSMSSSSKTMSTLSTLKSSSSTISTASSKSTSSSKSTKSTSAKSTKSTTKSTSTKPASSASSKSTQSIKSTTSSFVSNKGNAIKTSETKTSTSSVKQSKTKTSKTTATTTSSIALSNQGAATGIVTIPTSSANKTKTKKSKTTKSTISTSSGAQADASTPTSTSSAKKSKTKKSKTSSITSSSVLTSSLVDATGPLTTTTTVKTVNVQIPESTQTSVQNERRGSTWFGTNA